MKKLVCLTAVVVALGSPVAVAAEPPSVTAGSSSQADAARSLASPLGRVAPAGPAIRRIVGPGRRFRIAIPNVGSLAGPRGAVSKRGVLVIRPYRAILTDGFHAAGLGVDVVLKRARLTRRLTLTQRVRRAPAGAVPLVAHRGAKGRWDIRRGQLVQGRHIRVKTKRFSINIPAWANPLEWGRALGRRFAAVVGGRTSPVTCSGPPRWLSVSNRTSTVHACAGSNDDAAGERGEVRIKSNRGAILQVSLAGPRDYAWVEGQPDFLRRLLGTATRTNSDNVVFLPKGDDGLMTVGYRQPARTSDYTLLVETTYDSLIMNLAFLLVDYAADGVSARVKYGATGYLIAKCSGMLDLGSGTMRTPAEAVSGASFGKVMRCVVEQAVDQFRDPRKAFSAALQLNDPKISRMTTGQYADQLTKTGSGLASLAWALRVLPVLQQGWQGAADSVAALITSGASTHVNVSLDGRPASSQPTPPSAPSPGPPPGPGGQAPPPPGPAPPSERVVVVLNQVTNGPTQMREDVPAYLSTVPRNYCKRDGCALGGTDMGTGAYLTAVCQTGGVRTTNGWDANPSDDGNPGLFESTRWYLIRWGDGRAGYLSEVWLYPQFRGGLGLPGC